MTVDYDNVTQSLKLLWCPKQQTFYHVHLLSNLHKWLECIAYINFAELKSIAAPVKAIIVISIHWHAQS